MVPIATKTKEKSANYMAEVEFVGSGLQLGRVCCLNFDSFSFSIVFKISCFSRGEMSIKLKYYYN
jgi:hypothetical protein